MRKPNFGVTTLVLCTLAGVGVASRLMEPLVPPPPTNRLADESAPFLRQAMRSMVDWYPMSQEPFAKARREGKPILLVIGVPSSTLGWTIENQILADSDAASFINRHFVCIRVDAQDSPQWLSTYLPLSRIKTGIQRGYQIWFLTPSGKYFDNLLNFGTILPAEWSVLLGQLEGVLDKYASLPDGANEAAPLTEHEQDLLDLKNAPIAGLPNFQTEIQAISAYGNLKVGGFPVYGRVNTRPSAFRFIASIGDERAFRALMDPLLQSPIVDWMDGGFFIALNTTDGKLAADCDKSSLENSELMYTLSQASVLFKDDLYRVLALRTFDYFQRQWDEHGSIWSSRLSDVRANGRSASVSFAPKRLREALNGSDLEFAREALGLRVETNPAMTIVLRDPRHALDTEVMTRVIDKLREAREQEPKYTGEQYLDVNGTVFARMSQTARALGDMERLTRLMQSWTYIEQFRASDDVLRTIGREDPPQAYLGDYLAYSDAALQRFLATGDVAAFNAGLRVLARAKEVFEDSPGVWRLRIQAPDQPGPTEVMGPEILDSYKESSTAAMIRLCNGYARLLRDPEGKSQRLKLATTLSQTALDGVSRYAGLSDRIAFFGSGYFCAALSLVDDAYAVTVGPNAINLANRLYAKVPTRLISPAVGDVRPDLQRKAPGIYVISGSSIQGPFSVDQAAGALPRALGSTGSP